MRNDRIKKIVFSALLAALVCVATAVIRIPTPGTGGYIHPGDAVVILSGIILGPVWGTIAAGLGSAFADLLGGYFIYAPVTFVIKGVVALLSGVLCGALRKSKALNNKKILPALFGGAVDVVAVSGGYFLFEITIYGVPAALLSVPANLIQGAGGLAVAAILCPIVTSIPIIRQLSDETSKR